MNAPYHLVVWLDHQTARLYEVTRESARETALLRCDIGAGAIHHKAGTTGSGHTHLKKQFLERISVAIGESSEILLVGPAQAKTQLQTFLELHSPRQAARIVGVEAMGPANSGKIFAVALPLFSHADRMIGKSPTS